jgi:metallophosphoesterase (TIGR00282 family)
LVNVLFIGDVVGDAGVECVVQALPDLKAAHNIHFVVCNGENSHEGRGINEVICRRLHKAGVDVITGGDHSFDKHLIFPYMAKTNTLLRPMNYPKGTPGFGYGIFKLWDGIQICVLNLRGNSFFNNPIICPFFMADRVLQDVGHYAQIFFVDMHAEASAEKQALAWYLDGRVSALCGTHTHVQTADERILPNGTGYLTDVGFTGAHNSVIGMDIQTAINRFRLQTPQRYRMGEGDYRLHAAVFQIDETTGQTVSIERLSVPVALDYTPEPVAREAY